ncbi:MAG: hypothetical protein R3A11_05045 [Bdellovibrionota bacterium]
MFYDLLIDVKLQGRLKSFPLGKQPLSMGAGLENDIVLIDRNLDDACGSVRKIDRNYYWVSSGEETAVPILHRWMDMGSFRIKIQKNRVALSMLVLLAACLVLMLIGSALGHARVRTVAKEDPTTVYQLPSKEKHGWLQKTEPFLPMVSYHFDLDKVHEPLMLHFSVGNVSSRQLGVFINRTFVDFAPGCEGCWSKSSSISLPSEFLRGGKNLVQFQMNDPQAWGVRDVFLSLSEAHSQKEMELSEEFRLAKKLFDERHLQVGNLLRAHDLLSQWMASKKQKLETVTEQESDLLRSIEKTFEEDSRARHMMLEKWVVEEKYEKARQWFEVMKMEYPENYLRRSRDLMESIR